MFKNKHLKQLRKVQALIKHYKESIEKLKSPEFDYSESTKKARDILWPMFYGRRLDPDEFLELTDASSEYISKLGLYLMNIADYADTKKVYEKQLRQLQKEERRLKDKLGIE